MIKPSLRHILRRTAEAFAIREDELRGDGARGDGARLAFAWLASGLTGGIVDAGQQIGRTAAFVAAARDKASLLRETDACFAELLWRIEVGVLAECGVSDRFDYPLPRDFYAAHVARQLTGPERAAMAVSGEALAALGAAYLCAMAELALLRQFSAPAADTQAALRAASAFVGAEARLAAARYTIAERPARAARDTAFKTLSTLIGDSAHGQGIEEQNARREPARAAD